EAQGVINAPIGRNPDSIIQRLVISSGQQAITHYQVLERLDGASRLLVELETGRTHQIRVHFSHAGHPLLGDSLYGGPPDGIARQALHCHELALKHPLTKEELLFHSDLPEDMRLLLKEKG